ncbi:hypothetical protein ACLB2K_032525 [Fragaria x ananassa]
MIGVIYLIFLDVVSAAMAIETKGIYSAQPRDFGGPSQGPSKKAASSSTSGSSAGSGYSSGSSSDAWNKQQFSGCFECGGKDYFRRDCPLLAQRTAPTQSVGQSSARGFSGGSQGGLAARVALSRVVVSVDVL